MKRERKDGVVFVVSALSLSLSLNRESERNAVLTSVPTSNDVRQKRKSSSGK